MIKKTGWIHHGIFSRIILAQEKPKHANEVQEFLS